MYLRSHTVTLIFNLQKVLWFFVDILIWSKLFMFAYIMIDINFSERWIEYILRSQRITFMLWRGCVAFYFQIFWSYDNLDLMSGAGLTRCVFLKMPITNSTVNLIKIYIVGLSGLNWIFNTLHTGPDSRFLSNNYFSDVSWPILMPNTAN